MMKHLVKIWTLALLLAAAGQVADAQVSARRIPRREATENKDGKGAKSAADRKAESRSRAEARRAEQSARRAADEASRADEAERAAREAGSPEPRAAAVAPQRPTAPGVAGGTTAVRRTTPAARAARQAPPSADGVTLRQQAFSDYQRDEAGDVPWQHVVYREVDVTDGPNASLYFPVEPAEGMTSLFRVILAAMCDGQLHGYEYLDGREVFTDKYVVKTKDVLDKFQIYYQVHPAERGGTETYEVDESDVPSAEVLSYFIKERWEFDQKHARYRPRVLALCPVVHRSGDFGGAVVKYPMCWFNYEDLRPLLRDHLVMSEGLNNTPRFTMEEFFALEQYRGDIYKVQNLRGLSLMQMYPDSASLASARDSIEAELRGFGRGIWVPEEEEQAKDKPARTRTDEAVAATEGVNRRNRRTHEAVDMEAAAEEAAAHQEELDERVEREGAAHSVRRRR